MLNLKDFQGNGAPNLGKRDHTLVNGEKKNPHLGLFFFLPQSPHENNHQQQNRRYSRAKRSFGLTEPDSCTYL